jgi:hypothetical protein
MIWPRTEEQAKVAYVVGVIVLILVAVALVTYLGGWWTL